jgi:hypothetical protein
MKTNFEKLIKMVGREDGLSASEREKMRYVLTEYMAFKPMPIPEPVSRANTFSNMWKAYLARPLAFSLLALVLVGVSFDGLAYAAEGTLPGDLLYPVKVNVVEPLQGALISTAPGAQIQWHMTLAERRLTEASALASEGKLGSTTEATLMANFSLNSSITLQDIKAEATTSPLDAAVSATNFSAQLNGYGSALAQLGEEHNGNTQLLQSAIHAQIASSENTTIAAEPASSSGTGQSAVSVYLAGIQQKTIAALHTSSGLLGSATLASSSLVQAQGQFENAVQAASEGDNLLAEHNYSGALQAFQSSLSDSARLDVLTHTTVTVNINTSTATSSTQTSTSVKQAATTTIQTSSVSSTIHSSTGTGNSSGQNSSPTLPPLPSPHPLPLGL